jgi:hypothetical protein
MGRVCGTYARKKTVNRGLLGKPEEEKPLGRPDITWDCNMRIGLE